MNNGISILALSIAMILLLAACSGQPTADDTASAGDRVCLSVRTINSFSPLSDREVLVTSGVNDRYLFTVTGVCTGLRSANAIAIVDSTTRICNDNFGRIAFRDFGLGRQVCRVGNIEPVASREAAEELVEAREAERRDQSP